jgi:hypothetical protein
MAKHKYIESPEKMWELFQAYKNEVKSNPRYRTQFVGKDGNMVYEPLERPLTMEGFENYCFSIDAINDLGDYFSNKDGNYSDYSTICSCIRKSIRQDQIEGGMVGQYNPSITQRLNGLVEKQHVDSNIDVKGLPINIITNSPPLANDEK